MRYSGVYAVILTLHLLAAVFVIGPLAISGVLAPRCVAAGQAGLSALRSAYRTSRVYGLASLLVPLLGAAMIDNGTVGKQWDFAQAWISVSLALYVVALVAVLAVTMPAQRKAIAAIEGGQGADIYAGRMQGAAGVAALAWTVIVVLMVFKPGA